MRARHKNNASKGVISVFYGIETASITLIDYTISQFVMIATSSEFRGELDLAGCM